MKRASHPPPHGRAPPEKRKRRPGQGSDALENIGNSNSRENTSQLIEVQYETRPSAEIIELRPDTFGPWFDQDLRRQARHRIVALYIMLVRIDAQLAFGDRLPPARLDVIDCGTRELAELASLWFRRELGL